MTILLAPLPIQSFRDSNGNPLAGGLLYTYQAGTSTLQSTYTDASGTTPNANPVVLNSRGEASVWLTSAQAFKLVLQDSYGVLIWSVDQVASGASSGANSDIVSLSGLTTALSIAQGGTGATTATAAAVALGVTASADLAAPSGAGLVGFALAALPATINTIDWAIKSVADGVNVLRYINPAQWAGILNRTTTYDCYAEIQAAINDMKGSYQPTVLTALSGGSTLYFPAGLFLVSQGLVVTKSCSRLVGSGWANSEIKYSGTGTIPAIITFRDSNNSELSRVRLNGNATSATQGAKACLGIDLAAFFTSHDVYMTNSSLYGLRASHMWESYFSNLYIRATGGYSTGLVPGAGVCFTAVDSTSTVFPSNESNNTTFIKSSLSPVGGLVRVDATAGATDNISFLDTVGETDVNLPAIQCNENVWHLEATNNNFQIKGGFYTSNIQLATGTGKVFYCAGDWQGCVRDYTVDIRKAGGNTRHTQVAFIGSARKVEMQNFTVIDKSDALISVLQIGGYSYISRVGGNIYYINSGTTVRTADFIFTDATSKALFDGSVTVQNGANTAPGNNTTLTTIKKETTAVYTTAAAQSIPLTTDTIINFDTSEVDAGLRVSTGPSWKYTAGVVGSYRITAQVGISNAANTLLKVFKNGIEQFRMIRGLNGGETIAIDSQIVLAVGDYIDVRIFVNQTGITLLASSVYNRVSVALASV